MGEGRTDYSVSLSLSFLSLRRTIMQMMIEYYLGQILQNPVIDPLSMKANVMLATRYAEAVEQEYKRQDEERQKKYEEQRRVEEEKRKQRKIASLKEDIAAFRDRLQKQAELITNFEGRLKTLKGRKRSTYAAKANLEHYWKEYSCTSNSLENLRKELELYEPKPTNTQPIIDPTQVATPAEVTSGYSMAGH